MQSQRHTAQSFAGSPATDKATAAQNTASTIIRVVSRCRSVPRSEHGGIPEAHRSKESCNYLRTKQLLRGALRAWPPGTLRTRHASISKRTGGRCGLDLEVSQGSAMLAGLTETVEPQHMRKNARTDSNCCDMVPRGALRPQGRSAEKPSDPPARAWQPLRGLDEGRLVASTRGYFWQGTPTACFGLPALLKVLVALEPRHLPE